MKTTAMNSAKLNDKFPKKTSREIMAMATLSEGSRSFLKIIGTLEDLSDDLYTAHKKALEMDEMNKEDATRCFEGYPMFQDAHEALFVTKEKVIDLMLSTIKGNLMDKLSVESI